MAHQTTGLVPALLAERHRYDLRVHELDWPQAFGFPLADVEVQIEVPGPKSEEYRKFTGRGTARNPHHALGAAMGEALERCWVDQLRGKQPSGGIALHTIIKEAESRATAELFERFVFYRRFKDQVPFGICAQGEGEVASIQSALLQFGVRLEVRRAWSKALGLHFAFVAADGRNCSRPFGARLGLSCKDDKLTAIHHALWECLRMVAFHLFDGDYSTLDGRHLWASDPKSWDGIEPLACGADGVFALDEDQDLEIEMLRKELKVNTRGWDLEGLPRLYASSAFLSGVNLDTDVRSHTGLSHPLV